MVASLVTKRGTDGLVHFAYGEGFGMAACSQAVGGTSPSYIVNTKELLHGAHVTCLWCRLIGENDARLY